MQAPRQPLRRCAQATNDAIPVCTDTIPGPIYSLAVESVLHRPRLFQESLSCPDILPQNADMFTTLIDPRQLMTLQAHASSVRVFDCSFDLMDPSAGKAMFETLHLQGATHAHLDDDLSAHGNGDPLCGGRHPLPSRESFQYWLEQQGVQNDQQVVVYDRQGPHFAARLWWMLKWCGHEAVAVLDGGLKAWTDAGGLIGRGPSKQTMTPGQFTLKPPLAELSSMADVRSRLGSSQQRMLDARAPARFQGIQEPLDPVAGHIPGALNRPFTDNLQADGTFKTPYRLRQEVLAALGKWQRHGEDRSSSDCSDVVHYCGSGVTAAVNVLAMECAGLGRRALYGGSWSEWSRQIETPKAQS